jgi:hypothetical protein
MLFIDKEIGAFRHFRKKLLVQFSFFGQKFPKKELTPPKNRHLILFSSKQK